MTPWTKGGQPSLVPASGFTAWLVLFSATIMGFLVVLFLGLGLAAGGVADRWQRDLALSATLRFPADAPQSDLDLALEVLHQTEGVSEARQLFAQDVESLLRPWLGAEQLPRDTRLPQLIAITGTPDWSGVRWRLQGEVPSAVLDDHGQWRAPVVKAANRLREIALGSAVLVGLAAATIVALAAQAALAANAQVISVLRLIGARDGFIAALFVRRFAVRAFVGSAIGAACGAVAFALFDAGDTPLPVLGQATGFQGAAWAVPLIVPAAITLIAALTTILAARSILRESS
ncbi:MAG: FtsX-like permease family protein [Pseudomonadota bacterium]